MQRKDFQSVEGRMKVDRLELLLAVMVTFRYARNHDMFFQFCLKHQHLVILSQRTEFCLVSQTGRENVLLYHYGQVVG